MTCHVVGADGRQIAPLPRRANKPVGAQVFSPPLGPPPAFRPPPPNIHLQQQLAAHAALHGNAIDPYGGPPGFQAPPLMPYQFQQAQIPQFPYYPYPQHQFHQQLTQNNPANYFPPPTQMDRPDNAMYRDDRDVSLSDQGRTTKSRSVTAHNKLLIECQYMHTM